MTDNIFGDLLEPNTRLKFHRKNNIGVHHNYHRYPQDPSPNQPIHLFLTTGGPIPYCEVVCQYTVDGTPISEIPAMIGSMELYATEWDAPLGCFINTWQLILPPQSSGTIIRYRFKARSAGSNIWTDADQGEEFSLLIDNDPPPFGRNKL